MSASDLVRLGPGCHFVTPNLTLERILWEANRGYRIIRLLSTMHVLCVCVDGKARVESLVPMREGRQPPELRPSSISALFGDAGWPQRYGYAVPYKNLILCRACVASMGVVLVDAKHASDGRWLADMDTRVMLTRIRERN